MTTWQSRLQNIALAGRSGGGKTTIAHSLARHGYRRISPGDVCRAHCLDIFGEDSKLLLSQFTGAVRAIRPNVWIDRALRDAEPGQLVVIDSLRFWSDVERIRDLRCRILRVEAPLAVRILRLRRRGQVYDPEVDDLAPPESELDGLPADVVLDNRADDLQGLDARVDAVVAELLRK